MGFAFNGVCYQTQLQAAEAHCSSMPTVAGDFMYSCARSSDNRPVVSQTRLSDNSQSQQYVLAVNYPACTESVMPPGPWSLSIADGAQISLSIALVWAVAWGVRMAARVLSQPIDQERSDP